MTQTRSSFPHPLAAAVAFVFALGLAAAQGQTVFSSEVPVLSEGDDGVPYELGMKFQADIAGNINAIRYWRTSSETGTHTGNIWSADGTLLASATFAGETASGWQEAPLAAPLAISADTIYVVSVGSRYYPFTGYGLADPIVNGHLSTVADGANGLFGAIGAFPTSSYHSANYFRDVVFTAETAMFSMVKDWGTAFKGEFDVRNLSDKRVETWTMTVDFIDRQITSMWGADYSLVSTTVDAGHTTYRYQLTPPDWNARIAPGASNTVGFLATPGSVPTGAVSVISIDQVARSSDETATYSFGDVTVQVTKDGDWQHGALLRYKLTNNGSEELEGWQLAVDFARSISSIWSADVRSTSGVTTVIDSLDREWNKDIPAGGTIEFGYITTLGSLTDLPLVTSLADESNATRRSALAAPRTLTTSGSSASFRMGSRVAVKGITAKTSRFAQASVKGKTRSTLTVAKLKPGRTKVRVKATLASGKTVSKRVTIIRR